MTISTSLRYGFNILGVSIAALTISTAAHAQEVDFSGERIELIVPFGEGGGADTYSRYMARVLEPYLPGEPTILTRNMPGGGSVNGANWFEQNANRDGTHFVIASTSTTLTYVLRPNDDRIQFNPQNWNAFIGSPMGRVIYVHANSGITGIEDVADFDGELLMGLQSPTGSDLPSILSLHLLDMDVRPIFGTDGGDSLLGFERGELTADADVASAFLQLGQPLVDAGTAVPLFTFGYEENGEIVRDPNFPDLPSFPEAYEIVHGEPPSGPAYEAWTALFHIAVMSSKTLALPPDTPQEIIGAYSAAAAELVQDETFLAESGDFIGTYPQLTGEAAQRSLESALSISDEGRQWITDYLKEEFDTEI